MVRVLFLFLTCFRVNVARTNNNPILRAFQNYGFIATEYCRRSDILTSFLMKMGESSLMPQNYKKQCSLGKVQKETRDGVGVFELDFKDGNLMKRKRVVICKQLFPASSQPARRGASLRKDTFPLALRRWGRFARTVPSGEKRGETDLFAGYIPRGKQKFSRLKLTHACDAFVSYVSFSRLI